MPEFDSTLEYRNIPDWPGCKAGSDGTIWSCRNRNGSGLTSVWRKLKTYPDSDGYLQFVFHKGAKKFCRKVHRLVLEAFVGTRPIGMVCRHFPDQNRKNNSIGNIQWATKEVNSKDREVNGTMPRGEKNPAAKITFQKAEAIREDYATGKFSHRELAAKYGLRPSMIGNIVRGSHWKRV